MKRFVFPLFLFLSLVLLLGFALRLHPQEIPSPLIGKPAPSFSLAQLETGKSFSPQDMKGKVWLLNVWASWCTSCRQEHPLLLDLAQRGVVPIVGLDYMDTPEDGTKWLIKHGNPYQLAVLDSDGKVGINYGVYGVPETFVIDKRGFVRLKLSGPVTPEFIAQKLLPLLKELNRA